MKRAVVLVSGGMDSAVTLALAREQGFACHALSVDYGQRHLSELAAADRVSRLIGAVEHKTVHVDLRSIGGSALTADIDVPAAGSAGIPVTYVPARNTIMLSVALGWAEVLGAGDIWCGVNAVDYSGYPDCRPEFYDAFQNVIDTGTKPETQITIRTPVIAMRKSEIVRKGIELEAPLHLTWSCYKDSELACGNCDSCALRLRAFREAGATDPIPYVLDSSRFAY